MLYRAILRHLRQLLGGEAVAPLLCLLLGGALCNEGLDDRRGFGLRVIELVGAGFLLPEGCAFQPHQLMIHALSGVLDVIVLFVVAFVAVIGFARSLERRR